MKLIKDILKILFAPLNKFEEMEYQLWIKGEIEL